LNFISENEVIKAKCLSEIENVCFQNGEVNLSSENLKKLTYLEACIKESLRLRPPVREWFRNGPGRDLSINGNCYHLLDGSGIFHVTEVIHTDTENFEDPLIFKPERFLQTSASDDQMKQRHPFAFIPFSAGGRNCIGQKFAMMEMKIILSLLLLNFDCVPLMKTDEITVAADLVAGPFPTLDMKIKLR